jgi:maltose alpha-D-glucosyltransferase/alpha-amylase
MRLNLGIRRRLAPLLGNDRARIELANSLLFTLPGSPVIYYGDEIGMGDNIWLHDRDGVRTPMQWTAGPHAGFSTRPVVDPATDLYAPVIDDEVYGYHRLNVEAQQPDPGSLLNRMETMIRVRKSEPALARGDVHFLDAAPAGRPTETNDAALAFLRTAGAETVLAVHNLSDQVQAFTLDLSAVAGAVPRDLFSGKRLPAINTDPYPFHLDRYGYRWLRL